MKYSAPKGTRDILPGESEKWRYIESIIIKKCGEFGYQEIRTPIFEQTELFIRGIGEVTDIVEKEMYTFLDKSDRSITLRPEGTAPVARAYLENNMGMGAQTVKLFYIGPMFRYERPQAGRYRQFSQFGIEAFGASDPAVDAEVIDLAYSIYNEVGLGRISAHVNSIGCETCRPAYRKILRDLLAPDMDSLCNNCKARYERNPMRILDCKKPSCKAISRKLPPIYDYLCDDCRNHFELLKSYLDAMNVPYEVDPYIVRGFDYYTKTVFEFSAEGIGSQDAVGGGGRYDGLIESCEGPPTPGVGFAAGLDRILLALEHLGAESLPEQRLEYYLIGLGENAHKAVVELASKIRRKGLSADLDYTGRSMKAQMRQAGRLNAKNVIIIGEDELSKDVVVLKDMESGEQVEIGINDIIKRICD